MSVITQLGQTDPNYAWIVGSLPLAVALDLAMGDLPGRSYPVQGMKWLIEIVEGGNAQLVARLGGGRGADLFGGLVVTAMVVGSSASLVWLLTDLADTIGGPASLAIRTGLIAAGLTIRSTGDRILRAAESPDREAAARWLAPLGGSPRKRLQGDGIAAVCVAAVGELTVSRIVAPLGWLAVGSPSAMWGYLAARSLRQVQRERTNRQNFSARVPILLTDFAEWPAAVLTGILFCVSAGMIRLDLANAIRVGWDTLRRYPATALICVQGTLAGALGIRMTGGRVFGTAQEDRLPRLGRDLRPTDSHTVGLAVRIMQISALLAAGVTVVLTLFWI